MIDTGHETPLMPEMSDKEKHTLRDTLMQNIATLEKLIGLQTPDSDT